MGPPPLILLPGDRLDPHLDGQILEAGILRDQEVEGVAVVLVLRDGHGVGPAWGGGIGRHPPRRRLSHARRFRHVPSFGKAARRRAVEGPGHGGGVFLLLALAALTMFFFLLMSLARFLFLPLFSFLLSFELLLNQGPVGGDDHLVPAAVEEEIRLVEGPHKVGLLLDPLDLSARGLALDGGGHGCGKVIHGDIFLPLPRGLELLLEEDALSRNLDLVPFPPDGRHGLVPHLPLFFLFALHRADGSARGLTLEHGLDRGRHLVEGHPVLVLLLARGLLGAPDHHEEERSGGAEKEQHPSLPSDSVSVSVSKHDAYLQ